MKIIKRRNTKQLAREAGRKQLQQIGEKFVAIGQQSFSKSAPSKEGSPPGVITGSLKDSLTFEIYNNGTQLRLGYSVFYGRILERGTKNPIVPIRAKALRITLADGRVIYRKSTKGIRPRPMLKEVAMKALKSLRISSITSNRGRSVISVNT